MVRKSGTVQELARSLGNAICDDEGTDIPSTLRSDPEVASQVLQQLATHQRPEVRDWVVSAAPELLGRASIPLLLSLARDRDDGVANGAVHELLLLEPASLQPLLRRLRSRLASADMYTPIAAAWTLARIGDRESLPLIQRLAETSSMPWHRKAGSVIAMFLAGDHHAILDAIRQHDHERMSWLARAAVLMGTEEARLCVEQCAQSAPDADCRTTCLARLRGE